MGLIAVMFVLFYVILIRPQQKRMKDQRNMLDTLKKGDKIVTGGGLYGTVSKIINDEQVEVDLGDIKVTAMRYTLQNRLDDSANVHKPANDTKADAKELKKAEPKKTTTKKPSAKKTAAKK